MKNCKTWVKLTAAALSIVFLVIPVLAESIETLPETVLPPAESEQQENQPELIEPETTEAPQTETPVEPTSEPADPPMPEPTSVPAEATDEPTAVPTIEPTDEPTAEPPVEPTAEPTVEPVPEASTEPTKEPVPEATVQPTAEPMPEATAEPTVEPTAEPTIEPTTAPTEEPVEPEVPSEPDEPDDRPANRPSEKPKESYKIEILVPDKWQKTKAETKVKITDLKGRGWEHIRIVMALPDRMVTIADGAEQDKEYAIEVRENCTIHVTLTDRKGNIQAKSEAIECFDRTHPVVKAGINNEFLCVEATDTISGVAAVYINGHKVTYRGTVIDAKIRDYADGKPKLAIQAVDQAGNYSQVIYVQNPFYGEQRPERPDPKPDSTKRPSGENDRRTPPPQRPAHPGATQLPVVTPVPTVMPTVQPTVNPVNQQEMMNELIGQLIAGKGEGQGFSTDGNMKTVDLLYSKATNKQFITLQTRNGETYYLVIDYDKPLDDKGDAYETYFLNMVDDRDLLDVVKPKDMPTPEPTAQPTPKPAPEPSGENEKKSPIAISDLLLLVGLGAAGLVYMKFKKDGGAKNKADMLEEDLDDEEIGEDEEPEGEEKSDA